MFSHPTPFIYVDHAFCRIFKLPVPESFFIEGGSDRPVAATSGFNVANLDHLIEQHQENYEIHANIHSWGANTNIPFNLVIPLHYSLPLWMLENTFGFELFDTYILVEDGVDVRALKKKLDKVEILEWKENPISLVLTPITQLRYKDPAGQIQSDVNFSHIRIFALAGILIILCSLLNHLTLFVTCVQIRLRELALRKVHGASNLQLAATLYTDFLLIVLLSLVIGLMLLILLLPYFKVYANIESDNIIIYSELFIYAIFLIAFGSVAGGIPVLYFRGHINFKGIVIREHRNIFRKGSLLLQLLVSLGMIFCSSVFIKQMRFLHNVDLGVNRHNVAVVSASCCQLTSSFSERIKQIPGILDALPVSHKGFLSEMLNTDPAATSVFHIEKDGDRTPFFIVGISTVSHFFDFFEIKFIEGRSFPDEGVGRTISAHHSIGIFEEFNDDMVLNESAMKEIGDAVLLLRESEINITGVVRDFFISPVAKARPTQIHYVDNIELGAIAYRHEEGMRQQTQQSVTQWLREEFSNQGEFEIEFAYMEDVFDEHFKSERALLTLLSVMTLACILIAVFGVYSFTSLTCQQRRKEIAIRKVYGAEVLDILNIFFKEYLILLAWAAFVAFPAGFLIMKRWLEGYVKQTTMDAWLYVAIFLAVFVVIVFSIFSTIFRSANQNIAEVSKYGNY